MQPQAKERQRPPEAGEARNRFSLEPLERAQPCQHLDFSQAIQMLDSRPPEL